VPSVPPAAAEGPSIPPVVAVRPIEARPSHKVPDVRAADAARVPDKQTLDARAMADVMSADSRSRGVRTPAAGALRTAASPAAADPRPAIPAPAASDIRTVSAAPVGTIVVSRSEVDGALADFARLAAAVRGSFSASGLAVDAVAEGSIFARAGLRAGDVVTAVDGAPLRSLDAAANLYARASTAKVFTAQIVRGGSPMTLHVAIQ
jgi:S1-C subfamily serine protease